MESLELGENIGEGEFGSVHKAVYMTEEGEEKSVAVKVKKERMDINQSFLTISSDNSSKTILYCL